VSFEARKTDPDNQDLSYGLPASVVSATAKMLDSTLGTFIDLGGLGVKEVPCSIVPPTGETVSDTGAIISFLLSPPFTATPGDYVLFIRCIFDNGVILTEDRKVKVNEFR
jgi:hypothetical protein